MSKLCKNCGAIMDDKDMFCDSCGTRYVEGGEERTTIKVNNNPFFEIEQQLAHCGSIKDVDSVREKIEREYDDARDREHLLSLVDAQYRKLQSAKDKGAIDEFTSRIEACNTLEGAFTLRDSIISANISHRDKYALMRELKVKTTKQNSDVVAQGLKLDATDRGSSFGGIIGCIILAAIAYAVYKFVPIHWISVVGKWGMYIMLGLGALMVIWFVVSVLRWSFASKEQKNKSRLFDKMRKKELYFAERDYIIADSDARYLRSDEISGKDSDWIHKARFEIYARHGAKYDPEIDEDLKEFFSGKAWYENCPSRSVNDADLNKYEVANFNLMTTNKDAQIKYID